MKYIILSIISFSLLANLEGLENSIVTQMEHVQAIENLQRSKYADSQWEEIERALSQKDLRIRVATYNMLFDHNDDKLDPKHRWPVRCSRVVDLVDDMQADIIGIQELQLHQVNDLLQHIGNAYSFFTKPEPTGEQNGILYKTERFEVVDSKIWYKDGYPADAKNQKILTMIKLKDKKTGILFAAFNTHLSLSLKERNVQAKFFAEVIKPFADEMPVIFTGDFNVFPNRIDLKTLPYLDGDYVINHLLKSTLIDAKNVSLLGHLGPIATFTNDPAAEGKGFQGYGTPGVLLDHIFVTPDVTVLIHAVQSGTSGNEFPSDHFPVVIDMLLNDPLQH